MLYRRGRPTSVELLLLVVVAQLALPLGCHPPLVLDHLLRIIGAARGLMSLRGVEVLQIRRGRSRPSVEIDVVWPLRAARTAWVCENGVCQHVTGGLRPSQQHLSSGILTKAALESGRAGRKGWLKLTSTTRGPKHLAALDQILDGSLDLCICEAVSTRISSDRSPLGMPCLEPPNRNASRIDAPLGKA